MTCRGFAKAFESQGHVVQTMYPGSYRSIGDHMWDIVFIEGWFPAISAFIHEVRRLTHGHARVYYFCLDPAFPGLDRIREFDVDAFFTNSHDALAALTPHAPHAEFMLLAAEASSALNPTSSHHSPLPDSSVVFIGNAVGINTKRDLAVMLREAIPFGLVIYGFAWDLFPEFTPYWGGVLPPEDLPRVYAAATAVLGATMDAQRANGMINNRVFEVLAAGSILISDHYDALETLLGNRVLYYKQPGDVTRHLETLRSFPHSPASLQAFVTAHHTYDHRVAQILNAHTRTLHPSSHRPNRPLFLVVVDAVYMTTHFVASLFLQDALLPALDALVDYHVQVVAFSDLVHTPVKRHDFILVVSCWDCPLDQAMRRQFGSTIAAKGLYLLAPPSVPDDAMAFYDVLFYTATMDESTLHPVRTNLQLAFGLPLIRPRPDDEDDDGDVSSTSCGWIAVGDWTNDLHRLVHLVTAPSNATNVVVFPEHARASLVHTVAYLTTTARLHVRYAATPMDVHAHLRQFDCRAIYLPGTDTMGVGGDWLVGIAVAMNMTLHVLPDTRRWPALFHQLVAPSFTSWDLATLTNAFRQGMTRALCLGRGDARVHMVWPYDGATVGAVFDVHFQIARFDVPQDGNVCIFVDDKAAGCLMRPNMHFSLAWPLSKQTNGSTLALHVALSGNVYGNFFAQTSPVQIVYVEARKPEHEADAPWPTLHKAYHIHLDEDTSQT
ncbi:Aste57867_11340 [Aphanomyces stellatus]|uniref:Aste57867_11340 protein n=1 Tax=Aphanomyces stellatus TaxID=120398 RepID=A0A485KSN4_9STRA|nr:hypothetical protein As57867_011298 [Aphanomyces stellatus]VFT88202.1 Aste57867_11340 [Aphanomyces stellatus]